MATTLKLRRGTTTQHSTFTGAEGEVTVDTTKDTLVVHDGTTAGGFPLAKESQVTSSVAITGGSINGTTVGSTTAAAGKFTTLEATGVTTVSAGTVSAPAITFTGDTNTGIFSPAADTIAFAEGGVEAMRIDSDGDVGIGTTSPASKLNIGAGGVFRLNRGDNTRWGQIYADNNGLNIEVISTTGEELRLSATGTQNFYTGSTPAERMRIDSSGNLLVGGTAQSGTANRAAVFSANKFGLSIIDTTAQAAGVGGALNLGGNYRSTGDAQAFCRVAAAKENSTDANFAYGMTFDTTPNGGTFTERMRIDSSGNVGIGTTSPKSIGAGYQSLDVRGSTGGGFYFGPSGASNYSLLYASASAIDFGTTAAAPLRFYTSDTERARITSAGDLLVNNTTNDQWFTTTNAGITLQSGNFIAVARSGGAPLITNRLTNDGDVIEIRQAGTTEGTISVSGTTVSYNGGHLSRWAQMPGTKDDTLVKGTVMSNLDEMNVYTAPTTYWTEKDELPEGVNVGDVKVETHAIDNEQLNKVKVSDVEGDVNVAGVFVNWTHDDAHQVDEINMAMTGDMIIRIAQGVVVQKGDLLMSAGDGTAKPQGDDIVRSKTVAKVTSNHLTCTYADGSYCVPCVLMAC